MAVGGRSDVTLELNAPCLLRGLLGPTAPVATIHLAAGEPERLVRALSERMDVGLGAAQ